MPYISQIPSATRLHQDLHAQAPESKPEISEQEIQSERVEFINRTNRRASPQARESELEIGEDISRQLLASGSGENDGIRIVRIYNPAEPGLGADIVFITESANFGHVNAIMRVIRGYISRSYEYNENDADLLSRFVLYYNARLRGDLKAINAKYSQDVITALSPEKAGIDRSYKNWSGNSQILIPLKKSLVRPGNMDMNDGELERESVEAPPTDRKKLDELQNNRKKEDIKRLDQKEGALAKQEQKLVEERKEIERQKDETREEITRTDTRITELKKEPEKNREEIAQAERQKEDLKTKVQELSKKEEQATRAQERVREERAEVADQKRETTSPQSATQASVSNGEVKRLAEENQRLKEEQKRREEISPNVVGEKILFMRVLGFTEESHYRSELWAIDTTNDDALLRSPYTNICGRDFNVIPDQGILVIGYPGQPDHNSEHHLVLLDPESLTVKATGSEVVFWRTPVRWMDGKIYVVEAFNNQFHLARFNPDLKLDARSSEPISPNSEITFTKDKIYLTGKKSGTENTLISVFKRSDLTHIKTFEPMETKSSAGR